MQNIKQLTKTVQFACYGIKAKERLKDSWIWVQH